MEVEKVNEDLQPVTAKEIPELVDSLAAALKECNQLCQQFKSGFQSFKTKQSSSITSINEIIEDLHKMHRDVDISQVTGASVGAVSGTTAAILLALAPFTAGATLVPAAVAGGVAVVGGIVGGGAAIVEAIVTPNKCKKAEEGLQDLDKEKNHLLTIIDDLENEMDEVDHIIELLTTLRNQDDNKQKYHKDFMDFFELLLEAQNQNGLRRVLERPEIDMPEKPEVSVVGPAVKLGIRVPAEAGAVPIGHFVPGAAGEKIGGKVGERAGRVIGNRVGREVGRRTVRYLGRTIGGGVGRVAGRAGEAVGAAGGKAIGRLAGRAVLGPVISVAFVGIDIWTIVSTSKDLANGAQSPAGKQLQEMVSNIEEVSTVLQKIRKEC